MCVDHSYDIALVNWRAPVRLGPTVNRVCLPTAANCLRVGEEGYVAGYGVTQRGRPNNNNLFSNVAREARVYRAVRNFFFCSFSESREKLSPLAHFEYRSEKLFHPFIGLQPALL